MGSQNAQKTRKPAEKASHFGCGYASLSSKYLAIQIQENTGVYRYIYICTIMRAWACGNSSTFQGDLSR